ncbi:hypothetical protein M514_09173, partial [Trichuris suis]
MHSNDKSIFHAALDEASRVTAADFVRKPDEVVVRDYVGIILHVAVVCIVVIFSTLYYCGKKRQKAAVKRALAISNGTVDNPNVFSSKREKQLPRQKANSHFQHLWGYMCGMYKASKENLQRFQRPSGGKGSGTEIGRTNEQANCATAQIASQRTSQASEVFSGKANHPKLLEKNSDRESDTVTMNRFINQSQRGLNAVTTDQQKPS